MKDNTKGSWKPGAPLQVISQRGNWFVVVRPDGKGAKIYVPSKEEEK